jgi:hypothetical protein
MIAGERQRVHIDGAAERSSDPLNSGLESVVHLS